LPTRNRISNTGVPKREFGNEIRKWEILVMTDAQTHAEAHHGPDVKSYLVIFGALSVFTAISFVVNEFVRHDTISATTGIGLYPSAKFRKSHPHHLIVHL